MILLSAISLEGQRRRLWGYSGSGHVWYLYRKHHPVNAVNAFCMFGQFIFFTELPQELFRFLFPDKCNCSVSIKNLICVFCLVSVQSCV